MNNFDLTKYLAEGKLHEAMSPQDVVDIADTVAEEFTKESADEGDFLIYTVGRMDGMNFELDTDTSAQSPDSIDPMGVGEGWGGNFIIKSKGEGYEVRNGEKGGLVAIIDNMGNFRMLSADESRAEMGRAKGEKTDYMERRREMSDYMEEGEGIEEAGGDAQLMPSDPIVGFSQVASEFRDKLENNPQIDKIADMIIAKMSAKDKEAFVQKFKGKDEKSIFKMAMAMLKGLDEAVIDRDSAAGKFVALLGNLAGLNLMALGGGVLGVFIGKVLLGVAIPVIPALISLVVSLIIRNVAGKLLGANDDYTGLTGLEENKEIKSNKMKKSELKEMIKAAMLAEMEVEETEVYEAEEDEDVEVAVSDEEEMDIEEPADETPAEDESPAELSGDEKAISDNLEAALEAARALGDEKLVDQIGNSITFFTRAHIVKEGDMLKDEAELELEEAKDEEVKENLNESMFPMWNKLNK